MHGYSQDLDKILADLGDLLCLYLPCCELSYNLWSCGVNR